MAKGKGKTTQPLTIWVAAQWAGRSEIAALIDAGHTIRYPEGFGPLTPAGDDPDLILHPAAHVWTDEMWSKPQYLEAAIKAARKRKKEAK